jgi:hypothetical protein
MKLEVPHLDHQRAAAPVLVLEVQVHDPAGVVVAGLGEVHGAGQQPHGSIIRALVELVAG